MIRDLEQRLAYYFAIGSGCSKSGKRLVCELKCNQEPFVSLKDVQATARALPVMWESLWPSNQASSFFMFTPKASGISFEDGRRRVGFSLTLPSVKLLAQKILFEAFFQLFQTTNQAWNTLFKGFVLRPFCQVEGKKLRAKNLKKNQTEGTLKLEIVVMMDFLELSRDGRENLAEAKEFFDLFLKSIDIDAPSQLGIFSGIRDPRRLGDFKGSLPEISKFTIPNVIFEDDVVQKASAGNPQEHPRQHKRLEDLDIFAEISSSPDVLFPLGPLPIIM